MRGDGPARGGKGASAATERPSGFTRSVARLLLVPALLALLLAGFIVGVDPYFMFGAPSVSGINESRPFYENNVVEAKPYQLWRLRPKAVALGSSRAEVGLSPDHPGWADRNVFNFAIPAANSYEVMLAFLYAQRVAAPLKQAVVGLDFLSYGVYRKVGPTFNAERYDFSDLKDFADFLDETLAGRRSRAPVSPLAPAAPPESARHQPAAKEKLYPAAYTEIPNPGAPSRPKDEHGLNGDPVEAPNDAAAPTAWDEKLYLDLYPDVAAVVRSGQFKSGYEHYLKNGRAEGRVFPSIPPEWDERLYLALYLDVATAVYSGAVPSGYVHYVQAGRAEGRLFAAVPADWDERLYLSLYPDVAAVVASGQFGSGYEHYLKNGRAEGRLYARIPPDWDEKFYLALYPDVAAVVSSRQFGSGYEHYLKNGRAEGRHYGGVPADWDERLYLSLYPDVAAVVASRQFRSGYEHYLKNGRSEGRPFARIPPDWDEKFYLALYPDIAKVVRSGQFGSGYEHYLKNGQAEGRHYGGAPTDWDEEAYLIIYPDVAAAIQRGDVPSGFAHYIRAGKNEGRAFASKGGSTPSNWNEAGYLAANPDVRIAIARGQYRNGFMHYSAFGRAEGRVGGLPPADLFEWVELKWPPLHSWLTKAKELGRLTFSFSALVDAIKTVRQQSAEISFSSRGQRVWHDHEKVIDKMGGLGFIYRRWLNWNGRWWIFWFDPPEQMYCLTHPQTHISGLDPFRFMVRRAHAEGTDLRLFVSPLHASVRRIIDAIDLGGRFEFWLRELVRINEEEAARAGREPFPLFDFGDANSITSERIPEEGATSFMHWYWEIGHYRQTTGDLVLDRVFGVSDPSRPLPADFGVRLTSASIEAHLERSRDKRATWATANPDLVGLVAKGLEAPREFDRQREATCW